MESKDERGEEEGGREGVEGLGDEPIEALHLANEANPEDGVTRETGGVHEDQEGELGAGGEGGEGHGVWEERRGTRGNALAAT